MGLETVFQILGWVGFTYGISFAFTGLLPSNARSYYDDNYKKKGKDKIWPISLPWIAMTIIWLSVLGAAALGAFWVHRDGNWNINPIPLLSYVMTIIAAGFWVPLFFSPCKENCTYISSALIIAGILIVATFILFIPIYILSAFLVVPLLAWIGFMFYYVLQTEEMCHLQYVPVLKACQKKWIPVNQ